jgi:L-iditol 2-dehydrogenase
VKAAVYQGVERIEVKEVPDPVCAEDGLVMRVEACGLCGSEVRTFYHGTAYHKPGRILGHEVAGVVVQVGPNVPRYKVGDRLACGPVVPCGECYYCLRGRQNLCNNRYPHPFPLGFAELMAVPSQAIQWGAVAPIPAGVSFAATTLAEPLSSTTKAHMMLNTSLFDTVVVIGAGPVGCMHVQMARLRGASKIIQTELTPARLETARQFGADVLINSSAEDPVERVLEETQGSGADIVVCAAPSTQAAGQAVSMARKGGKILWFAGLPSSDPFVRVDGNLVHYRDLIIYGTIGFTPRHFRMALGLVASGTIDPDKYISGTLPLEGIVEGIEAVRKGKVLKLVVLPNS